MRRTRADERLRCFQAPQATPGTAGRAAVLWTPDDVGPIIGLLRGAEVPRGRPRPVCPDDRGSAGLGRWLTAAAVSRGQRRRWLRPLSVLQLEQRTPGRAGSDRSGARSSSASRRCRYGSRSRDRRRRVSELSSIRMRMALRALCSNGGARPQAAAPVRPLGSVATRLQPRAGSSGLLGAEPSRPMMARPRSGGHPPRMPRGRRKPCPST